MPLSAGDRLGPYEIIAPIGAGGMGEVYRARDTKLDREVAVKVLPAALAQHPDRLARFEREAKVLAALNHPNIAMIHGLEDRAIVMELVEGPTLADRLRTGSIPLEESLRIAAQIADALEAAHERGIVHRDLKPANIKVRDDGTVKVLDFGLATAVQSGAGQPGDGANSPTLTMGATEAGVILGTAAYMSPEQAAGKPVDRRADIWSFGVVLWEMLTGKRLFEGETVSHTLADVLKGEINFGKLPKGTPATIRELLRRCLDRDVRTRLRDIGEARIAIQKWLMNPSSETEIARVAPSRSGWTRRGVAAAMTLAAVVLGMVSYRHMREESPRLVKMSALPPDKAAINIGSLIALSPDGRHLAFVAMTDGKEQLWVRDLDSLAARALTGTDGANDPFWSPDSRAIAFFADDKLKKTELAGGPTLTLCDAPGAPRGGSWGRNDVLLFVPKAGVTGILRVSAAGGIATPATEVDRASGEVSHFRPSFLPDGHHFLYSVNAGAPERNAVYVGDLDSNDDPRNRHRVLNVSSMAVYSPPGYLLFVRDRTLMAQPFDAAKLQTVGDAVPIGEQIDSVARLSAQYQFSLSQNDVLAYRSGAVAGAGQLTWVDRSGKVGGTIGQLGLDYSFRLSPDEKKIAFSRTDAQSRNQDIWVLDLARGVTSRLTFDPALDNSPLWSPDGSRIVYASRRSGGYDLYSKAANGAGQEELFAKLGTLNAFGTSWSRDGRFVMYGIRTAADAKTGFDLWIAPQFGDRKPFPYLQTQFHEDYGAFSPDGRWVAFMSDESGRNEIYVQAFPLSGAKFQISTGGGAEPNWRGDGSELFYRSTDGNLMAVPVKSGATFEAGVPKSLFPVVGVGGLAEAGFQRTYAVTNDGQRFLIAESVGGEKSIPITLVLNWQSALKK